MSPPAVLCVEALGVGAVQTAHAGRQLLTGRLDDRVVVVAHQADCVKPPAILLDYVREQPDVEPPVVVVDVDRFASGAPRDDMVEAVRQVATGHARHVVDGSGQSPAIPAVG
jgi:hypothetical protein